MNIIFKVNKADFKMIKSGFLIYNQEMLPNQIKEFPSGLEESFSENISF